MTRPRPRRPLVIIPAPADVAIISALSDVIRARYPDAAVSHAQSSEHGECIAIYPTTETTRPTVYRGDTPGEPA